MKILKSLTVLLLVTFCFSCSSKDVLSQEEEAQNLDRMLTDIEALVAGENCSDPTDWTFTSYGEKACGGPVGYIAYPTSIDTVEFLNKIEMHRRAQQIFNEKWGVMSDCISPAPPTGVRCEDGNPVFIY